MKQIESRIDVRLACLEEKVEAQLASFSLRLAPMQRAIMQVKEQIIEAVDEVTVVAHRVEENRLIGPDLATGNHAGCNG